MIIAILSQNGHTIGLFEHISIFQDTAEIHLFKSVRSAISEWVRPRAELTRNGLHTVRSEIRMIGSESVLVDSHTRVRSDQVYNGWLVQLPYTVSFWEQEDEYRVHTVTPDHFLSYTTTIHSEVVTENLYRQVLQPIQFRLQNNPVIPRPRELAEDAVCAITLLPLYKSTAYWLPCGHAFSDAILRALSLDERCPLCRRPTFSEDIVH